ncbi:MAG TPA: transposase [Candidatus Acidoferrum sp.]|nr:transposase [Candidatus Acidoferrum sp.]
MHRPSPRSDGRYTRGYLPHVRVPGRSYFVTFRLEGTLPQNVLDQYRRERDELIKAERANHQLSRADEKRLFELYSDRIESFLDTSRGECWLRAPVLAELVSNALRFFDGQRYTLGTWVVMPNHVHVIVRPEGEHLLDEILQSWKGYTGREANKVLARTGQNFWQGSITITGFGMTTSAPGYLRTSTTTRAKPDSAPHQKNGCEAVRIRVCGRHRPAESPSVTCRLKAGVT